jgi:rhodanese-related sulfurtransferase
MTSVYHRLLLVLLLLSFSNPSWGDSKTNEIEDIDVSAAARLIEETPDLVIIDIRTPGEFSQGHIPNAINIDFMAQDFKSKISVLDRKKTYLTHCQSGGRSGQSLSLFNELGFTRLRHLESGFAAWKKAGLPIEK